MAGVLRNLKPTMEPTGRFIRVRELVGGDARQSRMVEVRLGCREDRADFARGFCRARRKGSFDQCAKRPRKGGVVCGQHGGGHAVRERNGNGIRLSSADAGRLSGLARQIKRDGKADLARIPSVVPWLRERLAALKQHPELLHLRDDVANLTALRDFLLSGEIEMDVQDLTRLLAVITQVKANTVRTMAIEGRTVVPIETVKGLCNTFIDIYKRYVPVEQHAAVLEELRVKTRFDEPVPPYGAHGP